MAKLALVFSTLVWLILPLSIQAQESGPLHSESWYVTVKPGHAAKFEEALKAHGAMRRDAGDPRTWTVYTPVTGENTQIYLLRTCCYSWHQIDSNTAWDADNPSVLGDWMANVDPHIEKLGHYFYESDTANSHWPEDGNPPNYVGVTRYFVKAGEEDTFNSARHKLSQIALNQGWSESGKRWSWYTRVGGKPQVTLATPYDSYADMAPDEESFFNFLSRHLGADAAAELLDESRSATNGSHYAIWRWRRDLTTYDN